MSKSKDIATLTPAKVKKIETYLTNLHDYLMFFAGFAKLEGESKKICMNQYEYVKSKMYAGELHEYLNKPIRELICV